MPGEFPFPITILRLQKGVLPRLQQPPSLLCLITSFVHEWDNVFFGFLEEFHSPNMPSFIDHMKVKCILIRFYYSQSTYVAESSRHAYCIRIGTDHFIFLPLPIGTENPVESFIFD